MTGISLSRSDGRLNPTKLPHITKLPVPSRLSLQPDVFLLQQYNPIRLPL